MTIQNNTLRIFIVFILVVYLILLTKNILFKKNPGYYKDYFRKEYRHYSVDQGWKHANTKPFSTIRLFYYSRRMNPEYKQNNLWGNLVGFVPLGILLPMIFPVFRKLFITLFTGFGVSLFFELSQLKFGLGIFDVDDLILNTAGCLAGYLLFIMIRKLLGVKNPNHLNPSTSL